MPELPEVESVRITLEPQIIDQVIKHVECADYPRLLKPSPRGLAGGLTGKKITKMNRLGKLLILSLSGNAFFTIHLGMTGQLIVNAQKPDAGHIHLAARLDNTMLFYRDPRRFGRLAYYESPLELEKITGKMGPDALSISDKEFARRVRQRHAPIKLLLLNQSILSGVGNIYADEGLHLAGISPLQEGSSLTPGKLSRLNQALKQVMLKSLALGGSTVKNFVDAAGRPGTFQEEHRVYQRTGKECPDCGERIEKTVLGGRSTHYCPACQRRKVG